MFIFAIFYTFFFVNYCHFFLYYFLHQSGNVCYNSVQNHLSSSLLSKNLKIKIHRTRILLMFGCEIWSLTLREKRRLRVFKNSVLRIIFSRKRDEVRGE